MDANKDQKNESDKINTSDVVPSDSGRPDDGEFKIEIRKLEVPVRPRGVLAE